MLIREYRSEPEIARRRTPVPFFTPPPPGYTVGQQTPVLSVSAAPPTTVGTTFRPLQDSAGVNGSPTSTWDSTLLNMCQPNPISGVSVVDNFWIQTQNSCAGKYAFSFVKISGGVTTVTPLSVTPATTTGNDTSHSVTLVQGDLFAIQCVTASGASSAGAVSWAMRFTAPNPNQSIILGGMLSGSGGYPLNSAPNYGTFQGCAGQGQGTNGPQEIFPTNGNIKNLFFCVPTAVTTGSWSVAFQSGANSGSISTSSLSASIASGTTGSDTIHSVAVTAGQYVGTVITPTSSPTSQTALFWACEFNPSRDGESVGTYDITPVPKGTYYNSISGSDDSATLALVNNVVFGGFRIQNMYVGNAVATASDTVTFTVMRNGSPTAVTATLAASTGPTGASANDTTHSIVTADGDLIAVQTVFGPSGTGNMYPLMGLVLYKASGWPCFYGSEMNGGFSDLGMGAC